MKLNSGELATDVEEDGPSEFEGTITNLDKTLPLGKVIEQTTESRMTTSPGNKSDVNGSMDQFARRREPVEDSLSDSEENNSGSTLTPDEHEDLSDALADCKSTLEASEDDGGDLPEKISNLNLVEQREQRDASGHDADDTCDNDADDDTCDNDADDDTCHSDDHECPEGYVAINGVISKEEAEKRDRENAKDKTMREKGPSGGTPSNYQPNIQNYNHIAAKTFPVNVACPQFGQQPIIGGYGLSPQSGYGAVMGRQQIPPPCYQPQMQNLGKRSRDDRDEEPVKYVKPITNSFNNLSDPSKSFTCSNVVSKSTYSGGQVLVKTPEICDTTNSGEFDFMKMLGDDFDNGVPSHYPPQNILSNNNIPDFGLEQTHLDFSALLGSENRPVDTASEGYVSDSIASPYNESQGSPGDQTVYSPPPSVDSGTGSSVAHSPASQMDISSPRSNMAGFESNLDMYNPQSNFISPPSPANLNQPLCNSHEFINKPGYPQVFGGSPIYQPTLSNVAQVQPFSTSGQIVSQLGEPGFNNNNFTDFFDENKENLKEVMEVLADDIVSNEQRKTKDLRMPQNIPVPVPVPEQLPTPYRQKLSQAVQVQTPKKPVPIVSVPPNQIPVSMYPTATTAVTTASMVLVQQSPVTVNQGVSMAPTVINTTVPSFSQNLGTNQILVIPSQQTAPQPTTIVFVQPPPQPQSNKRVSTFIPIRPKLPSNIGKTSPTSKTGPLQQKSHAPQVQTSRTCEVPPVPTIQPVISPKPIAKTQKNSEKQLNIARRVVANMTKEDLQYVDSDGDTYLHVAVCRVEKFMVEALLERIVREKLQFMICKQNHEGQTPIYLAVSANQPEMVAMLIKWGAENVGVNMMAEQLAPNGQKDIRPALHSASSNGGQYLPTLQALLKSQDCNLNICNSDGYTALHCAILEHGQAVEIRDNSSQSMRLVKDSKPIIVALIKAGADPNAQDKKSGKTAFMYALETCDYNLIETLLSLIDITKIRSYFRTQAFDGSTCMKILESRKNNFPAKLYEKLTGIMSHNRNTFVCRRADEAS